MNKEDKLRVIILALVLFSSFIFSLLFNVYLENYKLKGRIIENNISLEYITIDNNTLYKSNRHLGFEVDRKIEIDQEGFCIYYRNLINCKELDELKKYIDYDYENNENYKVLFRTFGEYKDIVIINENNMSNPEIIVFGGGVIE
jgi:hypothetical protein